MANYTEMQCASCCLTIVQEATSSSNFVNYLYGLEASRMASYTDVGMVKLQYSSLSRVRERCFSIIKWPWDRDYVNADYRSGREGDGGVGKKARGVTVGRDISIRPDWWPTVTDLLQRIVNECIFGQWLVLMSALARSPQSVFWQTFGRLITQWHLIAMSRHVSSTVTGVDDNDKWTLTLVPFFERD